MPDALEALRSPQRPRRIVGVGGARSVGWSREEATVTEYVSGELGGKIKAIICEWSKRVEEGTESGEYLESSTIYERLISEGVEVPDHAMSEILVELAKGGQIKLTMDSRHLSTRRSWRRMFGRRCKGGMVDQTSGVPEYSVKDAIAIRVTVEHDFQLERRVVARFEHEGGKEDAPERSANDHVIDLVANARDITQDSPLQTTPPGATSTILLRGTVSGKT